MLLESIPPREQSGRDSFSRYRAQVRSAAIAALQVLSGGDFDRIYCDLHDDIVIRKKDGDNVKYIFYQVKTRAKKNQNWTLLEAFGMKKRGVISADEIKKSFVGKMLIHTITFNQNCNSVIFQTNINNEDDIDNLLSDIEDGKFTGKFSKVLLEKFNDIYKDELKLPLSNEDIKARLSKLKFENDVYHLKDDASFFGPLVRAKIYEYSEIDLTHNESTDIIIKLLELISTKSSGVIKPFTEENIEKSSSVSINDLLPLLSLSKEAYEQILRGEDPKAIKSLSIIQRTLLSSGASLDDVTFCSKCKTEWDIWYRNIRHNISELELRYIISSVRDIINTVSAKNNNSLTVSRLHAPLKQFHANLKSEARLYGLTEEMLLGAVFSEIIKGGI